MGSKDYQYNTLFYAVFTLSIEIRFFLLLIMSVLFFFPPILQFPCGSQIEDSVIINYKQQKVTRYKAYILNVRQLDFVAQLAISSCSKAFRRPQVCAMSVVQFTVYYTSIALRLMLVNCFQQSTFYILVYENWIHLRLNFTVTNCFFFFVCSRNQ